MLLAQIKKQINCTYRDYVSYPKLELFRTIKKHQ